MNYATDAIYQILVQGAKHSKLKVKTKHDEAYIRRANYNRLTSINLENCRFNITLRNRG